jgi:phosphodiesterase/alkaline phosphatase D-like protein
MVRAVSQDSAVIWTEWTEDCHVILTVTLANTDEGQPAAPYSVHTPTVTVGDHHYALLKLTGLHPSTWYNYEISVSDVEMGQAYPVEHDGLIQCFRTLDPPQIGNSLRLAYGSCRKLTSNEPDALSALGAWLVSTFDQRETSWPRLLLLIGDQIYADEHTGRRKTTRSLAHHPAVESFKKAQSFEEFTECYEEVWSGEDGIRQVFAALPACMIFDDHEITNSWNTAPTWRAQVLKRGFEHVLVDGLVAYWVYQGWGNPGLHQEQPGYNEMLCGIMHTASESGEDALEPLRAYMRLAVYEKVAPHWHYDIPTMPPIYVADVRADRPAILEEKGNMYMVDAPARILSEAQEQELHRWLDDHADSTVVLVSSVPIILPPLIGFAEYVMGVRLFQSGPLRSLGITLSQAQQRVAKHMSFDHWPVFGATWRELMRLLSRRTHDIVALSGDVHFSYAAIARRNFSRQKNRAALYQLVSTPFRNTLEERDKRLVFTQALLNRIVYGGLSIRILPLLKGKGRDRVPRNLLFQNTVAFVTFEPASTANADKGAYAIEQVYLGVNNGSLQEIARNALSPTRPSP